MNLSEFRTEAERLARDSVILRDGGSGEILGYWHGDPGTGQCISVADRGGWLNVYVSPEGSRVEVGSEPMASDVPLFGQAHRSYPPIDAVFLLGSARVQEYLAAHSWPRDESFNENFPHPTPGLYEREWQSRCPLYMPDVVAVLGGWHFPWPDGDWTELVSQRLIVWTLRGSEPWIEVFQAGSDHRICSRTT